MSRFLPSRRWLLGCASSALATGNVLAQSTRGSDDGIGGTGRMQRGSDDRGIGGTGIYGRISEFGSVIVNGTRVAYPPGATIMMFGRRVRPQAMKIGHVVRIQASGTTGALGTQRIEVEHLVVGPVKSGGWFNSGLTVMGQTVTAPPGAELPSHGEWVAVSGFRRPDGVIVATLIEPAPDMTARITGILRTGADGGYQIGDLVLRGEGLAGNIGRRIVAEGKSSDNVMTVSAVRQAPVLRLQFERMLVEGFVRIGNGRVIAGEGTFSARVGDTFSANNATQPQVLMLDRQLDGTLLASVIDVSNRGSDSGRGAGSGSHGGPGAGPGGPGGGPGGGGGGGGPGGGGPGGGGGRH